VNQPFMVTDQAWLNETNQWAESTTYEQLWQAYTQVEERMPETLTAAIASPAYFRNSEENQVVFLPDPVVFFTDLINKWQAFAPERLLLPADLVETIASNVFPSDANLRSSSVYVRGVYHIGMKGTVTYACSRKINPFHWGLCHMLVHFAKFCGIGAETTIGFGQCQPQFSTGENQRSNIQPLYARRSRTAAR